MSQDENTQRALGRIEGTQTQILAKLDRLAADFGEHKHEDQKNFSSIRVMIDRKIEEQNDVRETHLDEQDTKLAVLKQDADRAKGAGWVILSLLGALATFVGGAVIAATTGLINIKFH